MIIDRNAAAQDWARVLETYPLPPNLREHQLDAMSLLKQGNHVFLGKLINLDTIHTAMNHILAVPTGAGKTLPQLATILTLEGLYNCFTGRL